MQINYNASNRCNINVTMLVYGLSVGDRNLFKPTKKWKLCFTPVRAVHDIAATVKYNTFANLCTTMSECGHLTRKIVLLLIFPPRMHGNN